MDGFLLDDSGEVQNQRYRIKQVVQEEVKRVQRGPADVADARAQSSIVRPRTKYEQNIMDKIPERQRANLVQPQTVCGKTYEGAGFLATPQQVEFIDFDVGQTYSQVITLTNVSRSFNAFKVLELPKDVRDVLEVVYTPASTMSAGMTAAVKVIFTPKENVDISTHIPLLCKTGAVQIPVECRFKRVVISTSCKLVDFGTVVIAEAVERHVVITNDGALSCHVSIVGEIIDQLKEVQTAANGKSCQTLTINLQKLTNILLEPFSSLTLKFVYTPLVPSSLDSSLMLSFDAPDVDDTVVFFQGNSIAVPVYVSKNQTLDFQCCYCNTLYRETFTVRNTTKSAVRVQPQLPKELQGSIEYVPKFGFVQPESELDFQVKFTPSESLGAECDYQVSIIVAGQAMPIYYTLRANLTPRDVSFTPSQCSFGYCVVGEALSQPVKVKNNCRLTRTMGFVGLPAGVKVLPSSIFTLAPLEEAEVEVCLEARQVGSFKHTLNLKTEHDDLFTLKVLGEGKISPLKLSVTNMKLPACAFYDTISSSTLLTNHSSSLQRFSFVANPLLGVSVSPSHGEVAAGKTLPVTVTFKPVPQNVTVSARLPTDEEIQEEVEAQVAEEEAKLKASLPPPPTKKKSKAEEEAERIERERQEEEKKKRIELLVDSKIQHRNVMKSLPSWESSLPEGTTSGGDEPFSKHRSLRIPCYIENWPYMAIFLEVRTTVDDADLKPILATSGGGADGGSGAPPAETPRSVAEVSAAGGANDGSAVDPVGLLDIDGTLKLCFAKVPALQKVTKTITLKNTSQRTLNVGVPPFDPFGPFQIVRPLQPKLAPDHEAELVISFQPASKAVYSQPFQISAEGSNSLYIEATGEGLPAALVVSYDKANQANLNDDTEGTLAMGPCLAGEHMEHPLFFTNCSPFPLNVEISFIEEKQSHYNPDGSNPFSVSQSRFTLPAEGKTEIQALFTPTIDCDFFGAARIDYGGKGTSKIIQFSGSGFEKGVYAQFHGEQFLRAPSSVDCFGDFASRFGAPTNPVPLTLRAHEGTTSTVSFVTGNNKGSSNGEYVIEGFNDADVKGGWKLDQTKGNLAPGAKQTITLSFSPTQLTLESLPLPNVGAVSLCSFRIVLKGGSPTTDQVFHVQAKGVALQADE